MVFYDGVEGLNGIMDPNDDGAGTNIWRYITYTRDAVIVMLL